MNFRSTIYNYFTAGINTGENLQLKRNIIIAVSLCSLVVLLEVLVIAQILLGFVTVDQLPKVLFSTLGVLIPLYLLLVKKNATLGIAFLVASGLILELTMLTIYFDDDPYSHVMWAQVLTFPAVLLLGIKRSLVPMTIYSVVLVVLVYLRVDDSADSHWRTVEFHQFVTLQILILGFAFISEWTVDRMLQKLLQTQQQERDSAQTHALFMDNMLNQKKQLLADTAHELRAPLTVLKTDIEAMEDGLSSQEESYPVLHRKLEQIDHLIEDIYLISQADNQQLTLQYESIQLSVLGDELQRSFSPLAEAKTLQLTVKKLQQIEHRIEGDWQRLLQVFGNLLQNSIHYTDTGGQIEVVPQVLASGVEIAVHDSSPGVPENEHQRLFERFFRSDATRNRAASGSGLGLAICKAIVEAHGGSMTIAPSALGGLVVTSFLPFTQTDSSAQL